MKPLLLGLCIVLALVSTSGQVSAQDIAGRDSSGLPGDHFNLQGALEMFKRAGSPEEFEKLLNTQDNAVNNLDLNGDGEVDYVRVIDKTRGKVHALVLQVPVSEKESQDIAVIELEKTGRESATLQIIGDEDVYGEETIVEPDGGGEDTEDLQDQRGVKGPFLGEGMMESLPMPRVAVNVWGWPGVRFMYAPAYVVWVSPWMWRTYPAWWHPWRPLAWGVFHPFRARYRAGFALVQTRRLVRAHRLYAPARTTSVVVRTRYHDRVVHARVHRTTTVRVRPGRTNVRPGVRRGRR